MIRHSQKKAARHMTPTAHNTASINLLMAFFSSFVHCLLGLLHCFISVITQRVTNFYAVHQVCLWPRCSVYKYVGVGHAALLIYFGLRSFKSFMSVMSTALDLCRLTTVLVGGGCLVAHAMQTRYFRLYRAKGKASPQVLHCGSSVCSSISFSL